MLGNTQAVKNYFEQSGVQIRPLVSAEWNYNLIYQPYVTYSGAGQNLYFPLGEWSNAGFPKVSVTTNTGAKRAAAFFNPNAKRFTVNATSIDGKDNFEGRVSIGLGNLPYGANSYKVIFYVRSIDSNIINLSTQLSNDSAKVYGSTYKTIDNFDWQKVELVVGAKKGDTSAYYNGLNLSLDFVNTTLAKVGAWGIEVCNIEVYQITYFDYTYGSLWPTDTAFSYFRPGESYVNSGNINIPNVTRVIETNKGTWDNAAPCSPVVYSPRTLFSANSSPFYKNGSISPFSQYKYFVSERPDNGAVSIGASYEENLDVNKIVLKFNVSQSIPSGMLSLYNPSSTAPVATVSISSSQISKSGICILYYHPEATTAAGKWTTTKWAWSESNKTKMPRINDTGQITISQKINKVIFTQTNASVVNAYQNLSYKAGTSKSEILAEFKRLQVIEISPRLELDLSEFVLDYTITKELDNKGTPLPISAMSANEADISLSNIPLSGSENLPLSIFSTNANNTAVFVSPLKNLLAKNVKFYMNYFIPQDRISESSQTNRIIPGGVFYADSWDSIDVKVTKVKCYDIMKFLQTLPVSDYVSRSQSLVNIFTNIMDFAGFSDYNYDELYSVFNDSNQAINSSYFFADSKNKTVYDILREAFLAYQIAASVDEDGILRFNNLQQIITNNVVTYAVNDENIVVNSYTENIKTKIGKIIMRYRMPQIKRSLTTASSAQGITSIFNQAPDTIWKEDSEDVVPLNYLLSSIENYSQNYYTVNKQDLNEVFYTMPLTHNSYAIIQGEIISTGDKEFLLTDNDTGRVKSVGVSSSNELDSEVAQFSNDQRTANIKYTPTGRFLNVQRGLFDTAPKTHKVMSSSADVGAQLQAGTLTPGTNYFSRLNPPSIDTNSGSIIIPVYANKYTIITSKSEVDNNYNTYSARFKIPDVSTEVSSGLVFNLSLNNSDSILSSFYTLGIQATKNINGKKSYKLEMYEVSASGTKSLLFSQSVTHIINSIFSNEPLTPVHMKRESQFINLKFTVQSDKILVYINDIRVVSDKTSNKRGLLGTKFGFYSIGASTISTGSNLAELYACQSILDDTAKYHFTTQRFLDAIVANKRISEKFYMLQSSPKIVGLNLYDVQTTLNPSLGAEHLKIMYNLYYNILETGGQKQKSYYISVPESALTYSTIINSGFRLKFALVNNANYSVWTKSSISSNRIVNAQYATFSRNVILLTEQQTLERVLNPQNANEVIELQSDWLQSKKTANAIMGVVAKASEDFSKDITVSLFGNPLIQVGDVVSLRHNLKNIIGLTFFVQSVKNTFSQGLTTEVVLNKIGYEGSAPDSLKNKYPSVALPTYLNILGLSPTSGTTAGSTLVTIGNGIDFSASNPPTVYFDTSLATNVTVIDSSTLTCRTPAHSAGFVNVKVISKGVTYQSINYNGFEYRGTDVVLGQVNPIVVSDGLDAVSNTREVALDWTSVDERENAFKYTLSDGSSGTIDYANTFLYKILFKGLKDGQTYTYTITTLFKQNGAEIGSSAPVTGSFTAGSSSNPDTDAAPSITATAVKDSLNKVTFKISLVGTIADTYTWRIFDGTSAQVYDSHQQTSPTYTYPNPMQAGWYATMYAKNQGSTSNVVAIYFNDVQLGTIIEDPGTPAGAPAQPIIRLETISEGGGKSSARLYVTQDTSATKPNSYDFTIDPSRFGGDKVDQPPAITQNNFPAPVNGELLLTLTGFTNNTSYSIRTRALNGKGSSLSTQNILFVSTGGATVSNVSLSENLTLSWTGNTYFDSYQVEYSGSNGVTKTPSVISKTTGTTYKRTTSVTALSTNGTAFTDLIYSGQTFWPAGTKVTAKVTAYKGAQAVTTISSTAYTVPGTPGGNNPTGPAPQVFAQDKHQYIPSGTFYSSPGGSFFWYNQSLVPSQFDSWVWEYEIYKNKTSASGTPTTGTRNPASPNIPSNSRFYVDYPFVGTHYIRVRMRITYNSSTYYGAWGDTTKTFT